MAATVGETFECTDLVFARGGNRVLFRRKVAKSCRPDYFLLVVSSDRFGALRFAGSGERSGSPTPIAVSDIGEKQEAMLLMKAIRCWKRRLISRSRLPPCCRAPILACPSNSSSIRASAIFLLHGLRGNFVTPEIIASLEYGVAVLGTEVIMVMGHANCGAVKGTLQGKEVPGQISALFPHIQPAVDQAGPSLEATTKANAKIQGALLRESSTVISGMVKQGKVKVVASYYDVGTGAVTILD